MHPDFHYMKSAPGVETVQINVRALPEVRRLMHYIEQLDGDHNGVGGLVLEGIGRVIEDRLLDPEYRAQYDALRRAEVTALDYELAELDAITERLKP